MGFTAVQAARLSGCSPTQLETWREIGLVVPDPDPDEPGAPYGFRDLVALRMVAALLDAGLAMAWIRHAVDEVPGSRDALAGLTLVADGESVWTGRDGAQILAALRHRRVALVVALDRLADEVEREARAFDADRRAFVADLRSAAGQPRDD